MVTQQASNELYRTFGVSIPACVYDSEKGDIGAVLARLGIPRTRLGLAKDEPKKKNQRKCKWVRYERRHSNSLWHADWTEKDGKQILLIEDDASRLLVGFGVFDNATAENSVATMKQVMEKYGVPKQVMTDHGTHFILKLHHSRYCSSLDTKFIKLT